MLCHSKCTKYKEWRVNFEAKREHEEQVNSMATYRHERRIEYENRVWRNSEAYRRIYKGKSIKK